MITATAKKKRLEALADEFWASPDRVRQAEIAKQISMLNATRVVRGDEGHDLRKIIYYFGLDFYPWDETRPDRWVGNLSGIYDDGYEFMYSLYEARLMSAEEMADAEFEASYHWIGRFYVDHQWFKIEYTEGDVTIWEDED